jgi:phosphoribosylformylglycinamidine synthase subunit PurS
MPTLPSPNSFLLTPHFPPPACHNKGVPTVRVYVTLKPSLLDSAGRTVAGSLRNLGFKELEDARIGKFIELQVADYSEERVKEMCDKLLANPVIENYRFEVAP